MGDFKQMDALPFHPSTIKVSLTPGLTFLFFALISHFSLSQRNILDFCTACVYLIGIKELGYLSQYGDWTTGVRFPVQQRIFPLASVSRPGLRSTHPPTKWVPEGGPLPG
jgi:hypothetical protein